MMPDLPFEIQEYIIDHLHDDRVALIACGLVCRAWAFPTRRHLFRSIELRRKRDCLQLLRIIEESLERHTGVGDAVREIRVRLLPIQRRRRNSLLYELVLQILRYLPTTEILWISDSDLEGFMDKMKPDTGRAAHVNTGRAMTSVFDFPNIKAVHFHIIWNLSPIGVLLFIAAFPSLSTLDFTRTSWNSQWDALAVTRMLVAPQDGRPLIRIRELIINEWACSPQVFCAILEALRKPPFELHLQKLQCSSPLDRLVLSEALIQLGTDLEELGLEFEFNEDYDALDCLAQIDLSCHRDLRMVSMGFHFDYRTIRWPAIITFLSQIASCNLQEVKLHFYTITCSLHWQFFDWPNFNETIADLHEKNSRMTLTFHFHFPAHVVHIPEDIQPLSARLAGVLRTGMPVAVVRSVGGEDNTCDQLSWLSASRPGNC